VVTTEDTVPNTLSTVFLEVRGHAVDESLLILDAELLESQLSKLRKDVDPEV
jgi:hypothetical protein